VIDTWRRQCRGRPRSRARTLAVVALLFDGAIAQAQMRDPARVARAAVSAAAALVDAAAPVSISD